jgi:cell division protein ZapA
VADRNTVSVEIYGKSYVVRAGTDQEYTRTLARYVEDQMRKVAAQSKAVDTQKIAVLTALNIANDLFHAEKMEREKESNLDQRTAALLQLVENAG